MVLSLAMNVWWVLKTIGQPRYLEDFTADTNQSLANYDPFADL